MRHIAYLAFLASANAFCQPISGHYPQAALAFIDSEAPAMEAAVHNKDRTYFVGASERMKRFLEKWGALTDSAQTHPYPMCTDTVTDFIIVGLCKIMPPGSICEPSTFFPKYRQTVALCRAQNHPAAR
jgi:hypothetical protein